MTPCPTCQSLNAQLADLQARYTNNRRTFLAAKETTLDESQQQVAGLAQEVEALRAELATVQALCHAADSERDELADAIRDLRTDRDALRSRVAELESALAVVRRMAPDYLPPLGPEASRCVRECASEITYGLTVIDRTLTEAGMTMERAKAMADEELDRELAARKAALRNGGKT